MITGAKFHGASTFLSTLLKYGKEKPLYVYYDTDVDGLFAGHAMWDCLTKHGFKPSFKINENRQHGVLEEGITNSFLVVVDTGVSYTKLKELVDDGNIVVVIDHHELEYDNFHDEYPTQYKGVLNVTPKEDFIYYENKDKKSLGFIINNQYEFENEKYRFLSGCGVVMEVLHNIFKGYSDDEHVAWVGLTLLSDVRDIENPLARHILEQTYGLNVYKTKVLGHLVNQVGENEFAISRFRFDRNYIDYTFNPVLNAMFRFNRGENLIRLLRGYKEPMLKTIRKDQADVMDELKKRMKVVKYSEYDNLDILIVKKNPMDYFDVSNFIGYLANDHLKTGRNAVIIAIDGTKFVRGSFRGTHTDIDYREILSKHGLIALGHKVAFGLKSFTNKKAVWNSIMKDIYEAERVSKSELQVHKVKNLSQYGKKLIEYANENQYLLSNHFHVVKYTGGIFVVSKETAKMTEYKVSGVLVTSFDKKLTPKNAIIVPSLSNGFTNLFLQKAPNNVDTGDDDNG